VLHPAVADHDGDLADHGDVLHRERLAVDFDGMKRLAEERRDLVQQTGVDAHEAVLRRLANLRQLDLFRGRQRGEGAVLAAFGRDCGLGGIVMPLEVKV
jgi:hypothetical protein